MKKITLIITILLALTGLATAQSANETKTAIQQAQEDIKLMEEENIPTERVENLLESANNSYLAQKNFAEEGGAADYSRAMELTQQISDLQERSLRVSDRISALQMRINDLESTSVNLSQAKNELKAARTDFQSQRFEEADTHVEDGYSAISEAQSARTQIESFAAAQREDLSTRIQKGVDFLRNNTKEVSGAAILLIVLLTSFTKEFRTYRLVKKRKKKLIKKEVLENLITDLQEEYYMRKEGSPIQFNTKMERFEDMRRNTIENIEIINNKLENRRSLIFDPEEHLDKEIEIEDEEDIEAVEEEVKSEKPVEVKEPEDDEEKDKETKDDKEIEDKDTLDEETDSDTETEPEEDLENNEGEKHRCEECGEKFNTERGLEIHIERTHDSDIQMEGVVCPECGDVFDTERGMHIHRGSVH